MAMLPFVVKPRREPIIEQIGNEEAGIIEIERRGYLTTGEKAFVQQVQQFDNGTSEIVTTSRQVARKYGLGMDKAYNLVLALISNSEITEKDKEIAAKIEEEFAEQLTNVVKSLASSQTREELVMAACMIKYRIDMDFEISEISKIHPDLIAELAKLYREEDSKSLEAFKEKEQKEVASVEEAEKKPVKGATVSRSKITTGD